MNQVVDRIPTGFPTKVIGLISSIKYLIYCERNIDKKLSLFSIENGFTKDLKKGFEERQIYLFNGSYFQLI